MANEIKVTTKLSHDNFMEVKKKGTFNVEDAFKMLSDAGISSASRKESIYRLEIFSGKSEKERKALRKKLRNKRDDFVTFMLSANESKRKELCEMWKSYAVNIYKDIFTVYESNTSTDKQNDLATFTQILRKNLTK